MISIKEQLYRTCVDFVKNIEETVLKTIHSNQEALNSETKSSAGDKHEMGRAMLQLEMEKASQQLVSINTMKAILDRIDLNDSKIVKLGSLVVTNHANYFLAISAGEINIEDRVYYAISASSPIGKLLLGKKKDDVINFNREIIIKEIY